MKITHVEVHRIDVPAASPPFRWRDGLSGSAPAGDGAVLRIGTDEGVEGVALFARPGAHSTLRDLVDRVFRAELLGADPFQREWLWHRVWELDRIHELPLPTLGLIDIALWDLAGRYHGEPVWRLLGGFRDAIPAYASTSTFSSTAEFLDVADQCLALGYRGIKLHAWGDARRDADLCLALRAHVGPDVPLMYDGSAGFDLPDAIRLGRALSEADYLWYEEPIREFSIAAYQRLAETVDVPLLVAETSDGAHMNAADFIRSGAATFGVRAGTTLRGGVTGAMRTAHLADAYRLRAEVHGSDIPNHHLCMAISNTTYYESLVTSVNVVRERHVDAQGLVHAPVGPGIALPLDFGYGDELLPYVEQPH
ncbi:MULTISPECIES: enolase C-terminal domain-like protein [unclassified Streptomyces]|jgi:L-alanine-DL-glutamate epimerase-like enolase superfamily enzyme|uniref:enolase C-terminal domain-like protein n=1 Tax=unclassified Streptomyces TaxID=2593676 RepID=UPI002E27E463|nr:MULTISPECIES: enolase C-terminal domain-like protein [unclassified Streptomyces]